MSEVLPPPPPALVNTQKAAPIDREKVCPFLLRVFCQFGGHHSPDNFVRPSEFPNNELQIYTWRDATLRELTELIKSAQPGARRQFARLDFALIYPDKRGKNVMRKVGSTSSNRPGADDIKTLANLHFETGDYLDVAIF